MIKLLPCPFCGGGKLKFIGDSDPYWDRGISCKCGVEVYFFDLKKGKNVGVGHSKKDPRKAIAERYNNRK